MTIKKYIGKFVHILTITFQWPIKIKYKKLYCLSKEQFDAMEEWHRQQLKGNK